jgi:hypothetical protein
MRASISEALIPRELRAHGAAWAGALEPRVDLRLYYWCAGNGRYTPPSFVRNVTC